MIFSCLIYIRVRDAADLDNNPEGLTVLDEGVWDIHVNYRHHDDDILGRLGFNNTLLVLFD